MESGSWKLGGYDSSSKARAGSGDAWMEELMVRAAVSGDMMGDPFCELDATEEPLTAEAGRDVEACVSRLVWTWLGRSCFCCDCGMGILEPPRGDVMGYGSGLLNMVRLAWQVTL